MKFSRMFLVLFAILFIFASCKEGKDAETGGETVIETITTEQSDESFTSFTMNVNTDNYVITEPVGVSFSSSSVMFAAEQSSNISTNIDGEIVNVVVPPGFLVKKAHKIVGGNAPGLAITFYVDSTDDTTVATCVLSETGLCELEEYEPRKMSGLGNSPFFDEYGNKRRYRTDSELITVDMFTGLKTSIPFASNGQISINRRNGHVMVDDGAAISLESIFIPNTIITDSGEVFEHTEELFINEKKFFIPHKNGFLIQGRDERGFFRLNDDGGNLSTRYAQYNARYAYENTSGPNYTNIVVASGLDGCTSHIVGDDDIMICGSKVYDLGDASNDIKEVDFWSYGVISGTERRVLSDDNFLYIYSSSANEGEFLTRVDINIMDHFVIFDRNGTSYKLNSESISDNIYRACTDNSILEITTIDATPDILETIGECDQIVSF
jgi:hypothetical protein